MVGAWSIMGGLVAADYDTFLAVMANRNLGAAAVLRTATNGLELRRMLDSPFCRLLAMTTTFARFRAVAIRSKPRSPKRPSSSGGKSEEEARRTGAIDRADDQVEQLFKPQYQTVNSPIHRAVWERTLPVELFEAAHESTPPDVQQVMSHSLDVVRRHRAAETIYNAEGKIAETVLTDLAEGRLLGLAGRSAIWRLRRAAAQLHAVSDADGARSIRRSPAWRPFTAASGRSIRCARSATRSRSSDFCPSWPAASG